MLNLQQGFINTTRFLCWSWCLVKRSDVPSIQDQLQCQNLGAWPTCTQHPTWRSVWMFWNVGEIMYDLIVILKYTTRQYTIIQVYVCIYIVQYVCVHIQCTCRLYIWNWKPDKWSNANSCKSMSNPSCLVNQSTFYLQNGWQHTKGSLRLKCLVGGSQDHCKRKIRTVDNDDSIKGISSSRGPCSGSMLVFRDVHHTWMIPGMSKWSFRCRFFHSHLSHLSLQ